MKRSFFYFLLRYGSALLLIILLIFPTVSFSQTEVVEPCMLKVVGIEGTALHAALVTELGKSLLAAISDNDEFVDLDKTTLIKTFFSPWHMPLL